MRNYNLTMEIMYNLTGKDYSKKSYHNDNAYKVAKWVFCESGSAIENILNHFKMADAIIKNGKRVFYTADLFEGAGKYTGGMSINRLIRETGNSHETFIRFGEKIIPELA